MHYPLYIIFTRMSSFSAVCVGIFETMVFYSESIIIQPNNFSTQNSSGDRVGFYRNTIIEINDVKKTQVKMPE